MPVSLVEGSSTIVCGLFCQAAWTELLAIGAKRATAAVVAIVPLRKVKRDRKEDFDRFMGQQAKLRIL